MFLLSLGPFWDLCFPLFLVPLLIFICSVELLFCCIYHVTFSFFFSTCQSKKLVYCYFEKITNMLLVCLLEKTLSVCVFFTKRKSVQSVTPFSLFLQIPLSLD